MTIEIFFLMVIVIYLVLIAYGLVGSRRRGAPPVTRAVAAALMVVVPPLAILAALYSTGQKSLIAGWDMVTLGMLLSGIATAVVTEIVARRVMP